MASVMQNFRNLGVSGGGGEFSLTKPPKGASLPCSIGMACRLITSDIQVHASTVIKTCRDYLRV